MHIFYAHKALQSGTSFAERPPPSRVPPTGAPGSCRRAAGRATGRVSHQGLRVLNSHEPIRDVLAQSGCRVLWLCLRLCLFTVYLAGADAVAPVRGALGMLKLRAASGLPGRMTEQLAE